MKHGKLKALAAALAVAAAVTGCGSTGDEPASAADDVAATTPAADDPAEPGTPAATDSAAKAAVPYACELLSIAEIKKLTGLVVSVRTDTPDRCIWVVEKPTDSHYGGLTIGVEAYASAEAAKENFHWYVDEKVPGIGDEASVSTTAVTALAIRVGAAKVTITEQNPAITKEVLYELGRTAVGHAG